MLEDMQPYYYDSQGRLNLLIKAVPFDGPVYLNEKDVQGHRFTKSTDLGPLKEAVSYLDHNKLKVEHPYLDIDKFPGIDERVGTAEKAMTTEEGVIYRIIVSEHYRYKNMLKALAEKNMLLGSTTPHQRGVKVDEKSGEILRWDVVEVTPTWKAANPDAEQVWLKSILVEDIMAEKQEQEVVEAVTTDKVEETVVVEKSDTSLTDLVASTFKDVEKTNEKSVPDMFADMQAEIAALKTEVAALKTAKELAEKSIADIHTAFPKLVEEVGKMVKVQVNTEYSKSIVERQVVSQKVVDQHKQDTTGRGVLPGRDRKASFAGKAAG